MLKIFFHTYNLILLILYLYPGSILGFVVYSDISRQPQLTADFLTISSNHFYVFLVLTLIGYQAINNLKYLILYLSLSSVFLEVSHLIIPNRSFQFSDLFGNILGVLLPIILISVYKKGTKKK
tara:strand:- start:480 stop:848 length:369 start_codon:yes stop_codon:yes gene_type:complete